ncbi:Protein ECM13 [Cyberlindnera fabianii]|uniref:Protein ECM13 n=1 Tax=Cyberlindnera fabianii TaxID=36022 RepID=A0A1V2LCL5_CYBFA|nr:Protein ECM13 [Cyberlindnera fabianii]
MSSMADTYILASKARAKLTKEASRPDHDLRILVSHANMLDNLMDKIHAHRESILDGSYVAKNVSFTLPDITHVSIAEDDYDDEESEDEDDEDVLHTSQTHTPQTHNYDGSKPQTESPAVSHGDLLLENLHEESFVQTPTVLCT